MLLSGEGPVPKVSSRLSVHGDFPWSQAVWACAVWSLSLHLPTTLPLALALPGLSPVPTAQPPHGEALLWPLEMEALP